MSAVVMEHVGKAGTLDGYSNHGCRCGECRRLWREYCATSRLRREQAIPDDVHGKYTTYTNYLCRCEACTKAWRQRSRDLGKRRLASGTMPHGTLNGYNLGCRCELCKQTRHAWYQRRSLPKRIAAMRQRLAALEAQL